MIQLTDIRHLEVGESGEIEEGDILFWDEEGIYLAKGEEVDITN